MRSDRVSDLADGGAHHFAETIRKIKQKFAKYLQVVLTDADVLIA